MYPEQSVATGDYNKMVEPASPDPSLAVQDAHKALQELTEQRNKMRTEIDQLRATIIARDNMIYELRSHINDLINS